MQLTRAKILNWLLASFVFGVLAQSFFALPMSVFFILTIFVLIVLFVFYQNKKIAFVCLCALSLLLGMWRTNVFLQKMQIAQNKQLDAKEISSEVVIASDAAQKENYQQFEIFLTDFSEKILVQAPKNLDLEYGNKIKLDCTLSLAANRETQNEKQFDYRSYLAKEGIYYLCQKSKIVVLADGQGNWFYAKILEIRKKFENVLLQNLTQPEAGLASGIIFGGNNLLSKNTSEAFSRTGLTHIVAVSGYNVTIIAEYLIVLGIWLGLWRKKAIGVAIFSIFVFVLMVGFPASAVRAGVMASLVLWAIKNGRLANSFGAILLAASVMLFANPLLARWDIGFELSFLATIGIVLMSDLWEQMWFKKYDSFEFLEAIFLTISAQILVLPIIVYNFGTISLISVLANALVLPLMPLAMLLVFLTSLAGIIFSFLALPFAWMAYLLLHYIIEVVKFLAHFSWASAEIENVKPIHVFAYYAIVLIGLYFLKKWQKIHEV